MLKPWQLIRLKSKYGGVYVAKHKNQFIVQRQPTLLEVSQQLDAQKIFNLTTEETFMELAKQCLVHPDDPAQVPEPQIRQIAESFIEDIPLTEQEAERKAIDVQSSGNFLKDIATELWYKISGTTIHDFYNQPINHVMEMYATIRILSELAQKAVNQPPVPEYTQQQKQIQLSIEDQQPQKPAVPVAKNIEEAKKLLGKSLDEIMKELQKKGG